MQVRSFSLVSLNLFNPFALKFIILATSFGLIAVIRLDKLPTIIVTILTD